MAKTVLATGLAKVADKFIDESKNELPKGSPESDYFFLEAASQHGFEHIDDDGNVYVCNSRQIVALMTAATRYPELREILEDMQNQWRDLDDAVLRAQYKAAPVESLTVLQLTGVRARLARLHSKVVALHEKLFMPRDPVTQEPLL
jgi:hypothetical protein